MTQTALAAVSTQEEKKSAVAMSLQDEKKAVLEG
jgi:hypothetical protein